MKDTFFFSKVSIFSKYESFLLVTLEFLTQRQIHFLLKNKTLSCRNDRKQLSAKLVLFLNFTINVYKKEINF